MFFHTGRAPPFFGRYILSHDAHSTRVTILKREATLLNTAARRASSSLVIGGRLFVQAAHWPWKPGVQIESVKDSQGIGIPAPLPIDARRSMPDPDCRPGAAHMIRH